MPVVGKRAHVGYSGMTVGVDVFSHQYNIANLHIVDAVLQNYCTNRGQSYLLIIRNDLYVPEIHLLLERLVSTFMIYLRFTWMIQVFQITR